MYIYTLCALLLFLSLYNWLGSHKILQSVAGKSVLISVEAVRQVINNALKSACSSQ